MNMVTPGWYPYDKGSTIGQQGSERGIILRDEEHPNGARITRERDARAIPFAITCGIYNWMVHTHYCGLEGEATDDFERMKTELVRILEMIPDQDDPEAEAKLRSVPAVLHDFVQNQFP